MATALEKEHYQLDHAELGGELLLRWNFPAAVVAAVRFHHSPETAGDYSGLAGLITIADCLAHIVNPATNDKAEMPGLQQAFDIWEFSSGDQKMYPNRLQGVSAQAEVMGL